MRNEITSFKAVLKVPTANLAKQVAEIFPDNLQNIYSYTLYRTDNEYTLKYQVSQIDKYNNLEVSLVVINIINAIWHATRAGLYKMISYEQPELEILIEVLDPMICSISKEQHNHWSKYLEYSDIKQICLLNLCNLYNKGYYIHKSLLRRSLINSIYQFLRINNHRDYKVISLYSYQRDSDESVTLEDSLCDTNALLLAEDEEIDEIRQRVCKEQKELLIDIIGKRQYDQLIREYVHHITTGAMQRKVLELKRKLKAQGLTGRIWNKYFD